MYLLMRSCMYVNMLFFLLVYDYMYTLAATLFDGGPTW